MDEIHAAQRSKRIRLRDPAVKPQALRFGIAAASAFIERLRIAIGSVLISFVGVKLTQLYARRYGSGICPQRHTVRVGRKSDLALI